MPPDTSERFRVQGPSRALRRYVWFMLPLVWGLFSSLGLLDFDLSRKQIPKAPLPGAPGWNPCANIDWERTAQDYQLGVSPLEDSVIYRYRVGRLKDLHFRAAYVFKSRRDRPLQFIQVRFPVKLIEPSFLDALSERKAVARRRIQAELDEAMEAPATTGRRQGDPAWDRVTRTRVSAWGDASTRCFLLNRDEVLPKLKSTNSDDIYLQVEPRH